MQSIIDSLEKKAEILRRRKVIKAQLAEHPREPFEFALRKELSQIMSDIVTLDEIFLVGYSNFKRRCGFSANGEIDPAVLSDVDRAKLRKIQSLIREIQEI